MCCLLCTCIRKNIGSFLWKWKFKSNCLKQCFKRDRERNSYSLGFVLSIFSQIWPLTQPDGNFDKLKFNDDTFITRLVHKNSGIYAFYFFAKMMSLVFDSCSSYTSLECLTNRLPEFDCENVLSITCDE